MDNKKTVIAAFLLALVVVTLLIVADNARSVAPDTVWQYAPTAVNAHFWG